MASNNHMHSDSIKRCPFVSLPFAADDVTSWAGVDRASSSRYAPGKPWEV